MNRRPGFRLVLLDLAIVLPLLLIGWATFRLVRLEPQISAERRQSEALQDILREAQRLFKEGTNDLELARRALDLSWYDALLLKSEYLGIAERLESSLPELRSVLRNLEEGRSGMSPGLGELQGWIAKESERIGLERLDTRSKALQHRMAGTQVANRALLLTSDLGTLMNGIGESYRSCLGELAAAADNVGKPLVSSVVAQHLQVARQDVLQLSRLADQARADGLGIEQFLETQTNVESLKRRRRQEELVQVFSEAESPAELTRQLETKSKSGNGSSLSLGETGSLRAARFALVGAVAVLGIFLMLDLYWRLVVMPLRLKLMEREGQIQHQKKLAHFEELAAELAHEIRNPLTAISALLYTVQRKLQSGTPEQKDAAVIRTELDRVNQILKEFIQMTKPAPPKLELMSAGSLLKEVSDLMSPELQRHAVRLESHAPGKAKFYGDQQQLKQVLINLIQNAAESFEQGRGQGEGAVVLRARDEKMPFNGTPAKVAIIEVEDNGPGIRPEVQARLFEPFFSTKKEGTGLGLPISARIIDRHGGRLDVETQPGQGTTFRIVLPAHEQRN
jgi:signal transduction histidine kinase